MPFPFLHLQKRKKKKCEQLTRSRSFQSFPIKRDDRCVLLCCCRTSWWRRSSCSRTSLGRMCTLRTGWPWAWSRTGERPRLRARAPQHPRDITLGEAGGGESFSLTKMNWSAADPFFLHWNPRGLLPSLELFIHYSSFLCVCWTGYSLPCPSFQY